MVLDHLSSILMVSGHRRDQAACSWFTAQVHGSRSVGPQGSDSTLEPETEYLAVFIIITAEIPSVVDDPETIREKAEKDGEN